MITHQLTCSHLADEHRSHVIHEETSPRFLVRAFVSIVQACDAVGSRLTGGQYLGQGKHPAGIHARVLSTSQAFVELSQGLCSLVRRCVQSIACLHISCNTGA